MKPYQPPGLWEAVSYNGDATYVADHGESLYRRGLYTYWKRQSPPPDTAHLRRPTREVCSARRPRTNTPLQALVLLNDVTYVEAARALATRMMHAKSAPAAFGFRSRPAARRARKKRGAPALSRRAARRLSRPARLGPGAAQRPANRLPTLRARPVRSGRVDADRQPSCSTSTKPHPALIAMNLHDPLALTRRQFFGRAADRHRRARPLLAAQRSAPPRPRALPGVLAQPHFPPRAKRIIYLFMQGGPSQMDLFDPKPGLARRHGEDLPDSVRHGAAHHRDDRETIVPAGGAVAVQVRAARARAARG